MRIASRQVGSIDVLALSLLSGMAGAQSTIKTIAGNPVINRDGTDASYPTHYLIDTERPFIAPGKVTHWEIWADTADPVQFVIYRNTAGSYVEVGRSELVTPQLGYNLFALEPKDQIEVQAGDFAGAYLPVAGSISDTPGNGGFCVANLGRSAHFTAPNSNVFSFSCDRVYSLRAFWNGPGQ